jgi:hypothetical protein
VTNPQVVDALESAAPPLGVGGNDLYESTLSNAQKARLAQYDEAESLLNARPEVQSSLDKGSWNWVPGALEGIGTAAGAATHHPLGIWMGDVVGSHAGKIAKSALSPNAESLVASERAGAPSSFGAPVDIPYTAASTVNQASQDPEEGIDPETLIPRPEEGIDPTTLQSANGQRDGGRIAYKAGGKVDGSIEPLVQQLMTRYKHAKKAEDATTKPLLQRPDQAIVRALKVAKKAI